MKDTYVQAVTILITEGHPIESVLTQLDGVLRRRGHEQLYAAILAGVVSALSVQAERNAVKIVVATPADATTSTVHALVKELGGEAVPVTTTIDETLIGGAKVTYQNQQIDTTYKTALQKLYYTITTH